MKAILPPLSHGTTEQMAEMNEALLLGSVRQHELTEVAQTLNSRLQVEIVERKRAQESVRVSEIQYRRLFEEASDGILVLDSDTGIITDANPFISRLLDFPHHEIIGKQLFEIGLLENEAESSKMIRNVKANHELHYLDLVIISQRGRRQEIDVVATFYHEGDRGVVQCHIHDITERKKLEAQFLRAQRIDGIGTLAGGIAHDLNNVLAPIMMSVELLRCYISEPAGIKILDMISNSTRRGAEMVGKVLTFAGGFEGKTDDLNVVLILNDLAHIVENTFPKNIRIQTQIGAVLWHIRGDSTQIHQVLLNLCVNSRDAMPAGGQITLKAENLVVDDHYAGMNIDAHPGKYLMIEVEDTGHGIPKEINGRLFESFFTTKEIGKGTGLGLSTSLTIVRNHGGFIQVYSEPGKGARFGIYLPAAKGSQKTFAVNGASPIPVSGNGKTVLVVDDELPIREITRQTLEGCGYKVILASNGSEAVSVYLEHQDEIALVLTDMMMPVMDGHSVIQVLRLLAPSLRIIGASGLNSCGTATDSQMDQFLQKPYTADTLLNAIGKILAETEDDTPRI